LSESEAKEKEKPVKLEDAAAETGELIGRGLQKAWAVTKSFGKGLVDSLEETEGGRDSSTSKCPHCSAGVSPRANFCAACGKKL
jgi:hypothetical protein